MSYQERLDSAYQVLTQHNESIGKGNQGYVDPDEFVKCIKASGGTNALRLKKFRYEEILDCMQTDGIGPVVLAKEIAGIFRSGEESKRPISARRASMMQPAELVRAYDPEDPKNPVGKRLMEISRGEPFVVFDGTEVVHDDTIKLLMEVKQGHNGRDKYKLGKKFVKVYKVGESPPNMVDENPFYNGRALRPDGTCDQINRSWDGVPLDVRQLVRLIVSESLVKHNTESANNIMDLIMSSSGDAFEVLAERYQEAALKFNELEASSNLPSLKVPLNPHGKNGPFSGGNKVICG